MTDIFTFPLSRLPTELPGPAPPRSEGTHHEAQHAAVGATSTIPCNANSYPPPTFS